MPSSKRNKLALIILGSVFWITPLVKSGLTYDFGIGFWGPNGHDGVWHLSLINSLATGSLAMPIFSGESIKNYHLGFDFLLATIHRLTGVSSSLLYFQITPPILAVLIGLLTYKFVANHTKSTLAAWWSTFFVYFGGSFGWVLGKGESLFWSQQGFSTLINPPFALSLVVLLLALICLQSKKWILATLLFIVLPQVKIYGGVLALGGLLIASFFDRKLFKVFLPSALVSGLFFLIASPGSTGLLAFHPGWFLESLFSPDRMDIPKMFSALNTYRIGGIWWKAIPAYTLAFLVFWYGNMGSRIIQEALAFFISRKKHHVTWFEYLSVSIILAGGLIPTLFIQTGTSWNTIQFFYYSLFLSSILAGISMEKLLQMFGSTKKTAIFAILIILLTIPTSIDSLRHYLPNRPPSKISLDEIEALNFLSKQSKGIVLSYPAQINNYAPPPRSLYEYESTAYVSAYSAQQSFMEDEVNLNITGYNWQQRKQNVLKFFTQPSVTFLKENHIKYVYLLSSAPKVNSLGLKNIFSNKEVTIYQIP